VGDQEEETRGIIRKTGDPPTSLSEGSGNKKAESEGLTRGQVRLGKEGNQNRRSVQEWSENGGELDGGGGGGGGLEYSNQPCLENNIRRQEAFSVRRGQHFESRKLEEGYRTLVVSLEGGLP